MSKQHDLSAMDLEPEDPATCNQNSGESTTDGEEHSITSMDGAEKAAGAGRTPSSAMSAVCISATASRQEVSVPLLDRNSLIRKDVPAGSICRDFLGDTSGWKRRKRAVEGPDSRLCPSNMSAIDVCLMNAKGRARAEIFAPVEGTTFDSCQEAYEMYNLFSWESGFGIKHAKTRLNGKGYRSMHEIVCQCYGKSDKENSATTKTDCKSMIRLLRMDDHG